MVPGNFKFGVDCLVSNFELLWHFALRAANSGMLWTRLHLDCGLLDAASGVYSRLRMPSRSSTARIQTALTGCGRKLFCGGGLRGRPIGDELLKRRFLAQKGELRVNSQVRQPPISFFIRFLQP